MFTGSRKLLIAACVAGAAAMAAAACSGGPTSPSGTAGATIAGTVSIGGAGALAPGSTHLDSGLVVTVTGTNLSATVDARGFFLLNGVPGGNVELQFRDATVNASAQLPNVGQQEFIEIEVRVSGASAAIVSEVRSNDKVTLCHSTGNGSYHSIDVSVSAEPAHRAHGDGKVGDPVPASQTQTFGPNCQPTGPAIQIEKSTNGEDADEAPGPTVPVGSQVTWTYVVTNTGTVTLNPVAVTDDKVGAITCPKSTLVAGESMTCTATGTAIAGQYSNLATVMGTSTTPAATVTDTDASHYFGRTEQEEAGPKVQLCHRTGNGRYILIEVSVDAEPAHLAHGDGKPNGPVPGGTGNFGPNCSVN